MGDSCVSGFDWSPLHRHVLESPSLSFHDIDWSTLHSHSLEHHPHSINVIHWSTLHPHSTNDIHWNPLHSTNDIINPFHIAILISSLSPLCSSTPLLTVVLLTSPQRPPLLKPTEAFISTPNNEKTRSETIS